jgi:Flp pilus assembly CpaE family ATPase
VNSDSSLYLDEQYADALGANGLSIALIGPDEGRRKAATSILAVCQVGEIREFSSYPASLDEVPKLLEPHYDVVIIDLDALPEYALELVENICAHDTATVMVYSLKADSELLVRCMRAGAREFLTLPFVQNTVAEALVRASVRRPATRVPKKAGGRLLAFLGAKGGDGVTTLACNFAVSLAQESSQSTLLIDLDLPLGDAALNLGVMAEYSTINALENSSRLDSSFLSKLLVKHSSGVSVLAAPGRFPSFDASNEEIDKLIAVARQDFDNVVIDMGSRLDLTGTSLFKDGSTIYLVIQAGIAGLRNSNRLISQYFTTDIPKLEIVLNRYQSRTLGVAEDQITKALTRPAQWKIPNDYAAVRRMQHTAIPLAMEDSPISRVIRQMARTACGLPAIQEKGTGFSLKKISRSISAKMSTPEESSAFTQLGLSSGPQNAGAAPEALQPDTKANIPENSVSAPPAGTAIEAETQTLKATAGAADSTDHAAAAVEGQQSASTSEQRSEPETRMYRGSTYVRRADGEWHLQQTPSQPVQSEPAQPESVQAESAQPEFVQQESPVIAWSTPAPIASGSALSTAELNAMASVPGTFAYTPAVGKVLPAGTHEISVDFTPADASGYTTAQATVLLTVTKATPTITWPAPAPISYGTALSAAQLNAKTSVPGKFVYTPAAGEVLPAGAQTLTAAFTPSDSAGCTTAQATVPLAVTQATSAITWTKPAAVVYGAALGAAQLNAKASVPGTFVYIPSAGEVLPAGAQTLSAVFTPADSANYATAQATVQLTVKKAAPAVTWSMPAPIAYGTGLSAAQLNAKGSVPGTFVYTPATGAVLTAGAQTLSAAFTPTDSANYATAHASVQLTVTKATPIITWAVPSSISQGAALSSEQLNATALVSGTFVYTPAAGEVLATGTHTLSVTFSPMDAADYTAVQASVSLTVAKAMPVIPLPPPAAVFQDIAPSAAQFHVEPTPAPSKAIPAGTRKPVRVKEAVPEIAPAKASIKPSAEAPARASVRLAAEPPAELPADATGTALVRAGVPKSPIDVGPGLNLMGSAVLEDGTTIYLVLQPGSAGLPNANRLVSQFFGSAGAKPGIVINRFEPPSSEGDGDQTSAALIRPAYSPISSLIGQGSRSAPEIPATPEKKSRFSLKGLSRSIWSKISNNDETQRMTQLGLADEMDSAGMPLGATQPGGTTSLPARSAYASPAGSLFAEANPMTFKPTDRASRAEHTEAKRGVGQGVGAHRHHGEPETRVYKGSTYLKGADGQWHLKETQESTVKKESPASAWPMPAPIYYGSELSGAEFNAKSRPAPAKASTAEGGKPSHNKKRLPKKVAKKAAAKPLVKKAATKAKVKAAAKFPAKVSAKSTGKATAKPPVKAAKSAAKSTAKLPLKAAKSQAKAAAKSAVKTAAKAPAKATVGKARIKAAAKPPIKSGAKPRAKVAAKRTVKAAAKAPVKIVSEADVKAEAKAPVKTVAESIAKVMAGEADAMSPVKSGVEPPVTAAAKLPVEAIPPTPADVPAPKTLAASANSVPAPSPKPDQAAKPSRPAVKKPASKPRAVKPAPAPPTDNPDSEPPKLG